MPEDIITAETTENTVSETDRDADVGHNDTGVNDADFSEGSGSVTTETDRPEDTSAQNNSANARRRREAERKAELDKARKEAREQAIIEALGGKNPFSGEEIKDSADIEEYLLMKEIEKNGGDPISDYAKHLKSKEKKRIEDEAKAKADEDWYRQDRENFTNKHPDVNISDLINDEGFMSYAQGKVGEIPLADIYGGYLDMVNRLTATAEKNANKKAQQRVANAKASPGSLTGADTADNGYFTREQVQGMSKEEVHVNYDKIRESMKKWK